MVVKILCLFILVPLGRGLTANQGHDWNGDWPNLRLPVHRLPPGKYSDILAFPGPSCTDCIQGYYNPLTGSNSNSSCVACQDIYLVGMKISQSGIPWSSSANVNCRPPGSFSPHALWKSAMLCPITKSEILHAEAHPLGHSSSRRRVALHLHLHLLLLLQRQEAVEHPVPDDANIHVALARVRDFARQVAVPLGRVLREAWDGGAGVHELHMVPPRLERRCPRRTQACSPSISLGSSFAYFTSSEIKLRRGSRRGRRHREQTRLHPS